MLSGVRRFFGCRVAVSSCLRTSGVWLSSSSKAPEWNRAVSEAERIVGYSTSFLSLRCLLSDELSNVALQMRKLVGTNHPLLKTVRKLFYSGKYNVQTRGLLVLLVAKAAGPAIGGMDCDEVMASGIYQSQRTLAEITEMIHIASLIHKGVLNLSQGGEKPEVPLMGDDASKDSDSRPVHDDLEFGNKMSVLSGDFLLANASTGLAGLNNTKVVEMISIAIGDLMRAEFTRLRDQNGFAVLPQDPVTVEDWEQQTFLTSGSLIAQSCAAALALAKHSENLQKKAFEFGKQVAFAYQISEELRQLCSADDSLNGLSVTSLPFILFANSKRCDPSTRKKFNQYSPSNKHLTKLVFDDKSVLQETRQLCNAYGQRALTVLDDLNKSDARLALQNIVRAAVNV